MAPPIAPSAPSSWRLWRPVRRYYVWRYRSENPPLVDILLPVKTVELNETASWIWEQLDGSRLNSNIVEELAEKAPDIPRERLEADVLRCLGGLHAERLIYLHWEHLR